MSQTHKVRVLVQYVVEVEMDEEQYARRHFIIEDNGCPGTGIVQAATNKVVEECDDAGVCWACRLGGSNRIIDPSDECRHVDMKF